VTRCSCIDEPGQTSYTSNDNPVFVVVIHREVQLSPSSPLLEDFLLRTNPWLAEPARAARHLRDRLPARWIPRTRQQDLERSLGPDGPAHLLLGPRQAGKRSLVWALLATRRDPVLLLDAREPLVQEWTRRTGDVAAELHRWLPTGGSVFLQEAQHLPDAGRLMAELSRSDPRGTLIATASSTLPHRPGTGSATPGLSVTPLWPLSLSEVAPPDPALGPAVERVRPRRAVEGLLLFGGYPRAWTSDSPPAVLGDLVTGHVLREAGERFRIDRPDTFRRLVELAAAQIGQVVNLSEWARLLGAATSTVSHYVDILVRCHVLRLVRPFAGGRRSELTSAPKAFFVDNGLRNAIRGGFTGVDGRTDLGRLLENLVFTELLKAGPRVGEVRHWRTRHGAAVDFVLQPEPGRLVAVLVKASREDRPLVTRAARSFVKAYAPEQLWMVTRGEPFEDRIETTRVRGVPIESLPRVLAGLGGR